MKDTELRQRRDKALYEVYKQGLENGCFLTLEEALDYLLRQPAPCFFLDSTRLSVYFGQIEANISLIKMHSSSRRRVWCLYDRYVAFRKENPHNDIARAQLCEILVAEPAPEFFLSRRAIRQVIQQQVKEEQKSLQRKLA